mgnify:FL=1
MTREAGNPETMASDIDPGTRGKGVWTVKASDAQGWPELYLDGVGWTRIEPTPSRATPPVYAIPASSAGTLTDVNPATGAQTTAPGGAAPKRLVDPTASNAAKPGVATSLSSGLRWLTHGWGLVLLAFALGLLASLIVPMAAKWRRRQNLIAARTSAQQVEVQWTLLTSSLSDLGIARAPSRTPRQLRNYYDREASLQGADSEALGRVVHTLESSRYAAPGPVPDGFAADARRVLRAAEAAHRPRDRIRAALWSSDGLAQLRSMRASVAWYVGAPLRYLTDGFERRFRDHR